MAARQQQPIAYVQMEEVRADPVVATAGSAGIDLRSIRTCVIPRGTQLLLNTGVRFQIPPGYFGMIMGRSSLATSFELEPFQGVIDSDYRGWIEVLMINRSLKRDVQIRSGERIAQLVLVKTMHTIRMKKVEFFDQPPRG